MRGTVPPAELARSPKGFVARSTAFRTMPVLRSAIYAAAKVEALAIGGMLFGLAVCLCAAWRFVVGLAVLGWIVHDPLSPAALFFMAMIAVGFVRAILDCRAGT